MRRSDGEPQPTWDAGRGTNAGWSADAQGGAGRWPGPAPANPWQTQPPAPPFPGPQGQPFPPAVPPASMPGGSFASPVPPQAQGWGPQQWVADDADRPVSSNIPAYRRTPPAAPQPPDRLALWLRRVVLFLVACFAAYSLQSHSQHQFLTGAIKDNRVSYISYAAGWPLTYAHLAATNVPLEDVEPTPAFHYIQPVLLALDILILAVPLWLLLQGIWLGWQGIVPRFGPRSVFRRFVALSFAALPALLWLLGGLALGLFLNIAGTETLTRHPYFWLALAPLVPGFGLASGLSAALDIPLRLWPLDFGIFLLLLALPFSGLTACFYVGASLFGRGLRRLFGKRQQP